MTEFPMMPFWVGDYLKDTWTLTTEEHGAYLLLIMHYWNEGGPLVDDDRELQKITKFSAHKWKKTSTKLKKFFIKNNGLLIHGRIEIELENARIKREKATKAALARWEKEHADASSKHAPSICSGDALSESDSLKPLTRSQSEQKQSALTGTGKSGFSRKKKPSAQVPQSDKAALFSFWIDTCKMGPPDPKLTSSRLKLLNARLDEGYSMDDLAMAIVGCSKNPHNRGENDRQTKYMGWDLILRDANKVDYFVGCYHDQKKGGK